MISIHSLNLLPSENRARIGQVRLSRFFILAYGGLALLLALGIILLLPTYFFLYFQNKGITELAEAARQKTNQTEARRTEDRIGEANALLRRLETEYAAAETSENSVTKHLENIVETAPAGITLTHFSFEKDTNRVLLRGRAATRNDLLQFVGIIRSNSSFHDVESPVENILQDSNVSFTLSFTAGNSEPKKP